MLIFCTILFLIIPIFAIPIIILALLAEKNIAQKKIYAFMLAIFVSILLYYLIPTSIQDIFRYYKTMDYLRTLSFNQFAVVLFNDAEYLSNLWFYMFAKIGNNSLMLFFTSIISYSILIYVIFDYQKKKKLSNKKFNLLLIYFFSTFLIVYNITGVRFCLARLIFFFALYLDLFKNKKNLITILLYILPVFIHSTTIILLIFRIVLMINKGKIDWKVLIPFTIILFMPDKILDFANRLSEFGALSHFSRTSYYLNNTNGFSNIFLLQTAINIFILINILYIKIKKVEVNNKYLDFVLLNSLTALFFIRNSGISTRFVGVSITLSYILVMDLLSNNKSKNKFIYDGIILAFSIFYMSFQIIQLQWIGTYGSLFNYNMFKNIIGIFIK